MCEVETTQAWFPSFTIATKRSSRSRLILGLAIVLGALWSLGLVAFLMMDSSGKRFDMLNTISSQLRSFAWFYTAAMGLFSLWWHTSHRTTSLIFTRPGRTELWLASVFGSAFAAAFAIHVAGRLLTVVLALIWGIPLQPGFVWLTIDGVIESVIMVSVLTGLAAVLHPALAVLVVAFFTESIFYTFDTMLLAYIDANGRSFAITSVEYFVRAIHTVAPMLDPFAEPTAEVGRSLRVNAQDWWYLGASALYGMLVFGFWFLFCRLQVET